MRHPLEIRKKEASSKTWTKLGNPHYAVECGRVRAIRRALRSRASLARSLGSPQTQLLASTITETTTTTATATTTAMTTATVTSITDNDSNGDEYPSQPTSASPPRIFAAQCGPVAVPTQSLSCLCRTPGSTPESARSSERSLVGSFSRPAPPCIANQLPRANGGLCINAKNIHST